MKNIGRVLKGFKRARSTRIPRQPTVRRGILDGPKPQPTTSRWDKFKSRAKLLGAATLGASGVGTLSGASQSGEGAVNVYVNRSTNIGKQHNKR